MDGPCGLAEKVRDPGPEALTPRRDPEARELAGAGRPTGSASAHGNPPFFGPESGKEFSGIVREGSRGPFSSLTWPKTAFLMKKCDFSGNLAKKAQNGPEKINDGIPNVPHPKVKVSPKLGGHCISGTPFDCLTVPREDPFTVSPTISLGS